MTQCLVANNNESIKSEKYFHLFVQSMFPDKQYSRLRENLVEFLIAHADRISSADDLYQLCRETISEARLEEQFGQELNKSIESAEALTQSNRYAYATRQRSNAYNKLGRFDATAIQWPGEESHSLDPYILKSQIVDRQTAIVSAGSCFAAGIGRELVARGFNYPIEEPVWDDSLFSNCRWGAIYNIPSLKQLVLLAKGKWKHPEVLWSIRGSSGAVEYWDPFRENIVYSSLDEAVASREQHRLACERVFTKADVFIITLGMTEAWKLRSEDSYFSRSPWRLSPHLVEPVDMTVSQCLSELEILLTELQELRPNIKLIVTVSPIPLNATFRAPESHVIEANCLSKSRLRVAAEEFCRKHKDSAFYFPSYEKVMYCTSNPWEGDLRHLREGVFSGVLDMFMNMFCKE